MQTITRLADKRMRERLGIPRKAFEKNASTALEKGVSHKECTGRLKKYVDHLFLSHNRGSDIRLYCGYVYIFTRNNLVTVMPLPNMYNNTVKKITNRKGQ